MTEPKIITYKEIIEQTKNIPLEKLSKDQVCNRYIAYGTYEDFEDVEVQKLLIKYELEEWLIYSLNHIVTNQEVIDGITADLPRKGDYNTIRGKLVKVELSHSEDMPEGFYTLIVTVIGSLTNKEYNLNYIYTQAGADKQFKNEIEENIGKEIIAIAKKTTDNTHLLCCVLKSNKGIFRRM